MREVQSYHAMIGGCPAYSSMSNNRLEMEPSKEFLFNYKGFYFAVNTTPEHVASLENFEIKDSDIFIATYPKSGTVWTQNILSLILHEGHRNGTENMETLDRIPWVEYNVKNIDFGSLPLPRVFATHLPYYLTPRDLRNRKGRVIYVSRNPKDVLVSYYHFSKFIVILEKIPDFNILMERFLAGKGRIFFLTKEPKPYSMMSERMRINYNNKHHAPSILSYAYLQPKLELMPELGPPMGGNTDKVCHSANTCKLLIL
uniref:Sulfotransferase n=2 Tax=Coturnix japonica TaxID=93934 RepID=A0A8C2TA88_COTJA